MGSHPFREMPPESSAGAHCVKCGLQLPRTQLGLDSDGSVICTGCRLAAPPTTHHASDLAESMTKGLIGTLLALATLAWFVRHCVR